LLGPFITPLPGKCYVKRPKITVHKKSELTNLSLLSDAKSHELKDDDSLNRISKVKFERIENIIEISGMSDENFLEITGKSDSVTGIIQSEDPVQLHGTLCEPPSEPNLVKSSGIVTSSGVEFTPASGSEEYFSIPTEKLTTEEGSSSPDLPSIPALEESDNEDDNLNLRCDIENIGIDQVDELDTVAETTPTESKKNTTDLVSSNKTSTVTVKTTSTEGKQNTIDLVSSNETSTVTVETTSNESNEDVADVVSSNENSTVTAGTSSNEINENAAEVVSSNVTPTVETNDKAEKIDTDSASTIESSKQVDTTSNEDKVINDIDTVSSEVPKTGESTSESNKEKLDAGLAVKETTDATSITHEVPPVIVTDADAKPEVTEANDSDKKEDSTEDSKTEDVEESVDAGKQKEGKDDKDGDSKDDKQKDEGNVENSKAWVQEKLLGLIGSIIPTTRTNVSFILLFSV
jgi:AAA ATPase containing von Willebrand factor type A (vWA) domain